MQHKSEIPQSVLEWGSTVTAEDIAHAMGELTAEEMALGIGVRKGVFDGALFFRNMTPEELYAEFPTKNPKD